MTMQQEDEPPMFADPRRGIEEALFEMGAGYGDLRAEQGDDLDEPFKQAMQAEVETGGQGAV